MEVPVEMFFTGVIPLEFLQHFALGKISVFGTLS